MFAVSAAGNGNRHGKSNRVLHPEDIPQPDKVDWFGSTWQADRVSRVGEKAGVIGMEEAGTSA